MTRKVYRGDEVDVSFDSDVCIHAAECVRGLPAVFDRNRRPWVLPDNASASELASVIDRCPSGALQYRRPDSAPDERPSGAATVTPIENGPLFVRGNVIVGLHDGTEETLPRAALCRCGQSKNKPFCDNSHRETGFEAPGVSLADALAKQAGRGREGAP